jgi:ATP-binding cassette subfamily B protein
VFDHLQALSMSFFDREKAGVIVSRMTADVESLSELVQIGLIMFVSNGLLLVITILVLFAMSWQLALVCLVGLPIVVLASIKFQRQSNKAYLTVRDRVGQTLTSLQEGLSGVRVIQAFGPGGRGGRPLRPPQPGPVRRPHALGADLGLVLPHRRAVRHRRDGCGHRDRRDVRAGRHRHARHRRRLRLLLANLFEPVQQLSQLFNTLQSAGAALNKLFGLLDTPVELTEHPGAVDLPRRGAIEVEHVTFGYAGGEPVLRDVTLHIAAGERLALVGPTGAGKSTLAKLAARLYDPTEGRITYGGVDLRHATLRSLRERMVVVPQEGFLFNGTLADNVRIGRGDATDDEVAEALRAVGALDRFASLPNGLQMAVNARGTRLSAGRSSSSPWPAPRSPTRTCSCSTRPRRASTPGPRCSSRRRSNG